MIRIAQAAGQEWPGSAEAPPSQQLFQMRIPEEEQDGLWLGRKAGQWWCGQSPGRAGAKAGRGGVGRDGVWSRGLTEGQCEWGLGLSEVGAHLHLVLLSSLRCANSPLLLALIQL